MKQPKTIKARFRVEASHRYTVNMLDHKEQLTWFHSEGRSVNLIVTQKVVGDKLTKPRVVAWLSSIEGEDEAKAIYLDYARRHGVEKLEPWPLPFMTAADLRIDEEVELGQDRQPSMFGAPR